MVHLPEGWSLPRPHRIHHSIEDFLTTWHSPQAHTLPLRKFMEHTVNRTLTSSFTDACFMQSMLYTSASLACQDYQRGYGLSKPTIKVPI